jgi:hypothetical protein
MLGDGVIENVLEEEKLPYLLLEVCVNIAICLNCTLFEINQSSRQLLMVCSLVVRCVGV